jgi:hypothetical protein
LANVKRGSRWDSAGESEFTRCGGLGLVHGEEAVDVLLGNFPSIRSTAISASPVFEKNFEITPARACL